MGKKKTITEKILIAFIFGIVFGIILNLFKEFSFTLYNIVTDNILSTGGEIFLRALKMLVVPIVFCSLICGICNLKDFTSLGRISIKTISFYIFTTSIAISIAILLASIVNPGESFKSQIISNEIEINSAPKISEILNTYTYDQFDNTTLQ